MNELSITHVWMAGVVGMMITFGTAALYGYLIKYQNKSRKLESLNGQKKT